MCIRDSRHPASTPGDGPPGCIESGVGAASPCCASCGSCGTESVAYTHLDGYKRQRCGTGRPRRSHLRPRRPRTTGRGRLAPAQATPHRARPVGASDGPQTVGAPSLEHVRGRSLPGDSAAEFNRALIGLREARLRPEVRLTEVPAPQRIAPHAVALSGEVVGSGGDAELASGRFCLLYTSPPEEDPNVLVCRVPPASSRRHHPGRAPGVGGVLRVSAELYLLGGGPRRCRRRAGPCPRSARRGTRR